MRVAVDELRLKPEGRDRLNNRRNTQDKLKGDDAGHLIADMLDGSPTLENLVSQAMQQNRGAGSKWKAMEAQWKKALSAIPPKKVTDIEIRVLYDGGGRPTEFIVGYTIDGQIFGLEKIPNPIPGAN